MAEDTKNLYNPHAGLTGRDGGPYLDEEERRLAEIRRAAVEGREPDFDNAPATAGTPLVTAGQLVAMANPTSIPSQEQSDPYSLAVDKYAKDEDFPVEAFSERPVTEDESRAVQEAEDSADIHANPASPVYVSEDEEVRDDETQDDDAFETTPSESEEVK